MNKENKGPIINQIKITKDQWPFLVKLLAVAFVGVIILNFAKFFSQPAVKDDQAGPAQNQKSSTSTEIYVPDDLSLEKRLEKILSEIDGVGTVAVSIVYAEGPTREYAVNMNTTDKEIEEKDQSGGVRTTTERTEAGEMVTLEGNAQPVLVKESMPKIQGVLVVARGAENPRVKEKLFEAVQTLLQVPAHRITICAQTAK